MGKEESKRPKRFMGFLERDILTDWRDRRKVERDRLMCFLFVKRQHLLQTVKRLGC